MKNDFYAGAHFIPAPRKNRSRMFFLCCAVFGASALIALGLWAINH